MGVLPCNRKDCENIMCDTYISDVGYVCWECRNEFYKYLEKENINPTTEGQIKRELQKFMATTKDDYKEGETISVSDFFSNHTK